MTTPVRPLDGRPAVAAHRGASADHPENTMVAFRAAWDAGAAWLETDTQPTVDNVPVLIHDDDLGRTTSGSGPVREARALDIRTLDAGSWFGPGFADTRVPELGELLAELPARVQVLLEIKGPHTGENLRGILETSRASGADERVFLHSFERDVLAELHDLVPQRPLGLLTVMWDDDPIAACAGLGAVSYHPASWLLLSRPDPAAEVAALHAAGISVAVWTADDPDEWRALTDAGVDAIMTNKPAALVAWETART